MQDECASTEQPLTHEPTLLISELGEVSPRLHRPDSAGGNRSSRIGQLSTSIPMQATDGPLRVG